MERIRRMDGRKALRLLRACAEKAMYGPVTLSGEYIDDIARCEALPENQNGSDKTWVERSRRQFRQHYARAKRAR